MNLRHSDQILTERWRQPPRDNPSVFGAIFIS